MRADDSIRDPWGPRQPFVQDWPERIDSHLTAEPQQWVRSACVLCSTGCALDIGVTDGRIVGVRGRGADRVNRGRLGPKGLHGWMANHSPDRLTTPLLRRDGRLVPVSWDEAMDAIVDTSKALLARHGPGALGFYTSGQLMLEEYYTLGLVARGGIGTNHLDANTRLCTATAAMALMESFGTDGAPGSYHDYDLADTLLMVGHNMAETQTVLWSRVLDRRAGPQPPKLVVVDPRRTATARESDVHLAPRVGTNLALMNGLLRAIVHAGRVDRAFVAAHTQGYDELAATVESYTPELVADITGVPRDRFDAAAAILGNAQRLVASCLQGVYQSHLATAAAVQVNNLALVRGMVGKPGCTVFQMNGQPTAQNTRECGADGELAAFLNWNNREHVEKLARHWGVRPELLDHHAPPTHVMQMMRYAEEGSLRFLWVSGTNPAVSLPDAPRVRRVLAQQQLFLVVQDGFPNETTELADVVLPAAIWGEKTGCGTNADRTVHLLQRAIDPPGDARSDFDIFVDYARRMGFQNASGAPLFAWQSPEAAFDHFKALTRGRLCDYSGLSYAKLAASASGIQWPCNERYPDGCERLYEDGAFGTAATECESYGHDLVTGAAVKPEDYASRDPGGRARLKSAEYRPPEEMPDARYPLMLTTGRVVHHFHTRTKTGRVEALADAAGEPLLEINEVDARAIGLADGDLADVASRRGSVRVRVRIADVLPGHVFLPFHYGWHDVPGRAANELTRSAWDPVSKQPLVKTAAVRVARAAS